MADVHLHGTICFRLNYKEAADFDKLLVNIRETLELQGSDFLQTCILRFKDYFFKHIFIGFMQNTKH